MRAVAEDRRASIKASGAYKCQVHVSGLGFRKNVLGLWDLGSDFGLRVQVQGLGI